MEKIEKGEYVRTTDGKIGTFVRYSSRKANSLYKCPADCFIKLDGRKSNLQCFRDYIVKHSKQLIDLIEVRRFCKWSKGFRHNRRLYTYNRIQLL